MKKIFISLIILIIIGIAYYCLNNNSKFDVNNQLENDNKTDYISEIVNNTSLDNSYLKWIEKNLGNKTIETLYQEVKEEKFDDESWKHITGYTKKSLETLFQDSNKKIDNLKEIKSENISINFVGDISFADNWKIIPKLDERKKGVNGILSEDVINTFKKAELNVGNNEFTVSKRGEPLKGKTYTFRADPSRLALYHDINMELVTLANNHVYDFGKEAFYDMIDALKDNNINYIGAGKNLEEATKEQIYIINGYKIAFINATRAEKNIMTPEAGEEGGVFRCYDETLLVSRIKELKEQNDYTIVLVHWGAEGSHNLEKVQITSGKQYIDAGADLIVGTHAHNLQGFEFYKDKLIAYNLGDFIFNSKIEETGILNLNIDNDGKMTYHFLPALQKDEFTSLVYDSQKEKILNELESWSVNAKLDETGLIIEK